MNKTIIAFSVLLSSSCLLLGYEDFKEAQEPKTQTDKKALVGAAAVTQQPQTPAMPIPTKNQNINVELDSPCGSDRSTVYQPSNSSVIRNSQQLSPLPPEFPWMP